MHSWWQDRQDAEVLGAIKSQIGMSDYLAAIDTLKQAPEFVAGISGLQLPRNADSAAEHPGRNEEGTPSLPPQSSACMHVLHLQP